MEIPVYLFCGFLDAGKTKFLQETLEDSRFNAGEKTLLLLCEEGEEEYDPTRFAGKNVFTVSLDSKTQLNPDKLNALCNAHKCERVIIECNGMWLLGDVYNAMPDEWFVCQQVTLYNSQDIMTYNANMRNLVADKLTNADTVVFNRCTDATDRMELHKLVRTITRRADILYEFTDGKVEMDQIEDPLPFDINAPVITIEDRDYALWYRDFGEGMMDYDGKTVTFKCIFLEDESMPSGYRAAGRPIMTCCVEDVQFLGFKCKYPKSEEIGHKSWINITAEVHVEFAKEYRGKGPVLYPVSIEPAEKPEDELVYFS